MRAEKFWEIEVPRPPSGQFSSKMGADKKPILGRFEIRDIRGLSGVLELPGGYSLVKKLSVPLFGIAAFDLQLLIVNLSDEDHFLLEN